MIALPLKLEGCQILDANGKMIALVRGDMTEYRARGGEIVAAVNGFAKLPDLLEGSVREAIKHPLALLDKFEEHYIRLRESRADLLVEAKRAADVLTAAGYPYAATTLRTAIAKAEEA